jgi:hypothetical protein
MKAAAGAAIGLAGLAVGFVCGALVYAFRQELAAPDRQPTVEEITEFLRRYPCEPGVGPDADLSIAIEVFIAAGYSRDQLKFEAFDNACIFEFALGADSYLVGKGVLRRDARRALVGIDFVSSMDRRFVVDRRPSFSLRIFDGDGEKLILNTFNDTLYRHSGDTGIVALKDRRR